MNANQWALRIADAYLNGHEDGIDRQTSLRQCINATLLFYAMVSIACIPLLELISANKPVLRPLQIQIDLVGKSRQLGADSGQIPGNQIRPSKVATSELMIKPVNDVRRTSKTSDSNKIALKPIESNQALQSAINHGAEPTQPQNPTKDTPNLSVDHPIINRDALNDGKNDGLARTRTIEAGGQPNPLITLPVQEVSNPAAKADLSLAMGNIAPWRNEVLKRLMQVWHPANANDKVILALRLTRDGALVSLDVTGAKSEEARQSVIEAVKLVQFPATPDWYRSKEIKYRLTLQADQSENHP